MGPRILIRGNTTTAIPGINAGSASMGPRILIRGNPGRLIVNFGRRVCFNGAADFNPRKYASPVSFFLASLLASMGPRILIRGNEEGNMHRDKEVTGFNGAADFNPRKCGEQVTEQQYRTAALQWGRGF